MKGISPEKDIKIRHAESEDYRALCEIYGCPKVVAGTLQLPLPSLEMWRKRLSESVTGKFSLVAVVKDDVVGHLGLHTFPNHPRRKHAGTIGMGVQDDWQGKGIGRALLDACIDLAENWLNITRLELEVFTDNERAIKLYEHFGFEHEGTLRQHAFRNGRYVDSYSMARIRQMIIEGVITGAEKFGRDNVVPETEVIRLENTKRKADRPKKEKK